MKSGDKVKHTLMGWDGFVLCDLRDNPWCHDGEDWKVMFKVGEERKEIHVSNSEIAIA